MITQDLVLSILDLFSKYFQIGTNNGFSSKKMAYNYVDINGAVMYGW